jgi:hypothetical protein
VHPSEVDVSDEPLATAPLVEDLDRSAVLEDGDAGLRRSRVDEELLTHGRCRQLS